MKNTILKIDSEQFEIFMSEIGADMNVDEYSQLWDKAAANLSLLPEREDADTINWFANKIYEYPCRRILIEMIKQVIKDTSNKKIKEYLNTINLEFIDEYQKHEYMKRFTETN